MSLGDLGIVVVIVALIAWVCHDSNPKPVPPPRMQVTEDVKAGRIVLDTATRLEYFLPSGGGAILLAPSATKAVEK